MVDNYISLFFGTGVFLKRLKFFISILRNFNSIEALSISGYSFVSKTTSVSRVVSVSGAVSISGVISVSKAVSVSGTFSTSITISRLRVFTSLTISPSKLIP